GGLQRARQCHWRALRPPALHARPAVRRADRQVMNASPHSSVSILTQTCVRPESAEDFARWQGETSTLIAQFPGFIEQRLTPPKPPLQEDWVILQRFESLADAQRWLTSPERQRRIEGAAPMLLGRTDVHIVQ